MMQHRLFLALCSLSALAACASSPFVAGGTETTLPLSRAWFDGRTVEPFALLARLQLLLHPGCG